MIKIDQIFRVLRIFRDLAGPCLQRLQGLQERVQEHGPAPRGAGLTITAMAQARSQARSGTTTWPEALARRPLVQLKDHGSLLLLRGSWEHREVLMQDVEGLQVLQYHHQLIFALAL